MTEGHLTSLGNKYGLYNKSGTIHHVIHGTVRDLSVTTLSVGSTLTVVPSFHLLLKDMVHDTSFLFPDIFTWTALVTESVYYVVKHPVYL